jgi:hypothetical protein
MQVTSGEADQFGPGGKLENIQECYAEHTLGASIFYVQLVRDAGL